MAALSREDTTPKTLGLTPTARVPCINAANTGERKTLTQSEFCTWQNCLRGKSPQKCIQWTSPGDGQTSCKVWLTSVERHRCSNEAKRRNPLKFAGVLQTRQPISAVSGPKFTILWALVEESLLFNNFLIVDSLSLCKDISRQNCAMVRRWLIFA